MSDAWNQVGVLVFKLGDVHRDFKQPHNKTGVPPAEHYWLASAG